MNIIKKIDDGKGRRIDVNELFSSVGRTVNKKMMYIRIFALVGVIIFTALITAIAVGAFSDDSLGGSDKDSSLQVNGDIKFPTDGENEGESESEETTDEKNSPPSTDVNEGEIKYIDYSEKELGGFYVKNHLGSALIYDPYAEIPKYYSQNDALPLVLIIHTEGSFEYKGDSSDVASVIGLGQRLSSALNSLGIPTVHCSALHESSEIADSYNNAEESIQFYLKIYPSIKYIFDISAICDGEMTATMGSFDKKLCSQILFEICGQNKETRNENLSLAVNLRSMLNRQGMSVAREIVVADNTLNSRYVPYYMTMYIGTVNNTADESRRAVDAFALAFAEYLNKQ